MSLLRRPRLAALDKLAWAPRRIRASTARRRASLESLECRSLLSGNPHAAGAASAPAAVAPPGQDTKHPTAPPADDSGQGSTTAQAGQDGSNDSTGATFVPPGQAKKDAAQSGDPSGSAGSSTAPAPANTSAAPASTSPAPADNPAPPGQAKKAANSAGSEGDTGNQGGASAANAMPPGQAKKDAAQSGDPSGSAGSSTAPAPANTSAAPASTSPAPADNPAPPGQAKKDAESGIDPSAQSNVALPPGQAKKDAHPGEGANDPGGPNNSNDGQALTQGSADAGKSAGKGNGSGDNQADPGKASADLAATATPIEGPVARGTGGKGSQEGDSASSADSTVETHGSSPVQTSLLSIVSQVVAAFKGKGSDGTLDAMAAGAAQDGTASVSPSQSPQEQAAAVAAAPIQAAAGPNVGGETALASQPTPAVATAAAPTAAAGVASNSTESDGGGYSGVAGASRSAAPAVGVPAVATEGHPVASRSSNETASSLNPATGTIGVTGVLTSALPSALSAAQMVLSPPMGGALAELIGRIRPNQPMLGPDVGGPNAAEVASAGVGRGTGGDVEASSERDAPLGSDRLADSLAVNLEDLDRALRGYLDQAEGIGGAMADVLAADGVQPWLLGAAAAAALACVAARRASRKSEPEAALAGVEGPGFPWPLGITPDEA